MLGIELSEVTPLPRNPTFNSSVAEAANHEASVRLAEQIYYKNKNAMQVKVTTYPWDVVRTRNTKRAMGDELASFHYFGTGGRWRPGTGDLQQRATRFLSATDNFDLSRLRSGPDQRLDR